MNETIKTIKNFIYLCICIFTAMAVFALLLLFVIKFNPEIFLNLVNDYVKILISSWSGTVLILGILLMISQQESIYKFISERLISVGTDGIKGSALSQDIENQKIENVADVADVEIINTEKSVTEDLDYRKLYSFERSYNIIFGSQIRLLENLKLVGDYGLSYQDINDYFEKIKMDHWKNVDPWSLEEYLRFLINFDLIIKDEKPDVYYKITEDGIEFLEHIEKFKYNKNLPL